MKDAFKRLGAKTDSVSARLAAKKQKLFSALLGTALTAPAASMMMTAMAVDVTDVATNLIKWVGGGAIVLGIITLVVGLMTFFGAEDDGPQKSKGKGQIAAGIVVIAVGGALQTTLADTMAGWIADAFSA